MPFLNVASTSSYHFVLSLLAGLFGKMVLIYCCLHFCFSTHCYMTFYQTIKITLVRVTV